MNKAYRFNLVLVTTLMLAFTYVSELGARPVKTYKTILGYGLTVDVHVTGQDRRYATVEFNSNKQHMGVIMLSPIRPEQVNLRFRSDTQSIHVERIALRVPQEEVEGEVMIEANYTNEEDGPLLEYDGSLANWKLP